MHEEFWRARVLLARITSYMKPSFASTAGDRAKGYKSGRPMLWMKLFSETANSDHLVRLSVCDLRSLSAEADSPGAGFQQGGQNKQLRFRECLFSLGALNAADHCGFPRAVGERPTASQANLLNDVRVMNSKGNIWGTDCYPLSRTL